MHKSYPLLVYGMLSWCIVFSQELPIENLFDGMSESNDQSALMEYLAELQKNPLDLNNASARQLSTIPWISPVMAISIIHYRHQHGAFSSVNEVLQIKGISDHFERIKPFVTVKGRHRFKIQVEGRHRSISKLEASRGYLENVYRGSPYKVLNRLKGSVLPFLGFGLLTEKDAGEPQWDDLRLGYVECSAKQWKSRLLLGHFSAEFGQGLVFWGPYKFSKGSNAIAPAKQRSRGIYRYLSVDENSAFYGAAAEVNWQPLQMTSFYSRNSMNARVRGDSLISMPATGLHRNEKEREVKDTALENVIGLAVQWRIGTMKHIGLTFQKSALSHHIPRSDTFEQHEFYGIHNHVFGLDYDVTVSRINLFGEAAQSKSGGQALLLGSWWDFDVFDVVLLWRKYDDHFHNFHALAFGERRSTRNEEGFYLGLRYRATSEVTLSWYIDQFRSRWPQHFIPMPSSGYEIMALAEYECSRRHTLSLRGKFEKKHVNWSVPDRFAVSHTRLGLRDKVNLRLQSEFFAAPQLNFRTRLELSTAGMNRRYLAPQDTIGTMVYQDVIWKPNKAWRLQTRWTLFDAPLYELRFYQFEQDLPGVMRLKMLYGRGTRWFALVSYKWKLFIRLSMKYERTVYEDRTSIGSGYDRIASPSENMVSLQLDWFK